MSKPRAPGFMASCSSPSCWRRCWDLARPFPPGATRFAQRQGRNRCLWREEAFLLHLLQQAVNPPLGLRDCLDSWDTITLDLREPRRKRRLQAAKLERYAKLLS